MVDPPEDSMMEVATAIYTAITDINFFLGGFAWNEFIIVNSFSKLFFTFMLLIHIKPQTV